MSKQQLTVNRAQSTEHKKLFAVHCTLFTVICALCSVHCISAFAEIIDANAPKTITAPRIEYSVKSEEIKTVGKTEVSNTGGQRMTLTDSYLSGRGENASGRDIELFLGGNVYVSAGDIERAGNDSTVRDATFTACHGCDDFGNAWEISANKITHDLARHNMSFNNSVFWIYDMPVFYLPWMLFPDPSVKRRSGLLFPSFNSTNQMGTQFNVPIYLSFSDTHDATVTLSYLTGENPLFQLEHRLNARHSEYQTTGSYTRNKEGENRWHVFNSDTIELGENARARLFVQRASDKTYLQKYGFYEDQPYLDSGARLELFGTTGYAVAEAHAFQELRTDIGRQHVIPSGDILPNIRGRYQTSELFADTYAVFDADVLGVLDNNTSSQRMIGAAKIMSPWTLPFGIRTTVSAGARYDIYNFINTDIVDAPDFTGVKTRFLPSGYLDMGLPLLNRGENITQILEPRARITVMNSFDEAAFALNNDSAGALLSDATLFSENRFSGLDLWENGNYADYGMRWAAFDNSGQNLELFAGQSYDFTERPDTDINSGFHDGASDWVGRVGYDDGDMTAILSRFRFDRDTMALRHIENDVRFGTSRNFVTAGHIWAKQFDDAITTDSNINEVMGGFNVMVTERLGFRFEAIYNVTESTFQRHTGGLHYTHPCYFLALEYRRDNTRKEDYVGDTTFQFRFGLSINGEKL